MDEDQHWTESTPVRPSGPDTREVALVGGLLVAAFLVRFIPALQPSYWYDEVYTVAISDFSARQIIELTARDVHPPLYLLIIHALMAVGERVSGALGSLAWLRAASYLPGWLTCVIGWSITRRFWGGGAALAVLFFLAFSPPLAFFSVELRNYALADTLLIASTACLLMAMVSDGKRALRWSGGYVASMVLALYTQNLALLYLAAHGVIVGIELAMDSCRRTRRARLTALSALAIIILYLPWLPRLLEQNERLNMVRFDWLPTAQWIDLIPSLFFHPIYGPMDGSNPWVGSNRILLGAPLVLAVLFLVRALVARFRVLIEARTHPVEGARQPDHLFRVCGLLTFLPLGLAFFASRLGISQVFMPTRYNLLIVPFAILFSVRLVQTIDPIWLRRSVLVGAGVLSIYFTVYGQWRRVIHRQDTRCVWENPEGPASDPALGTIYWTDPAYTPWLGQGYGGSKWDSFDRVFDSPQIAGQTAGQTLWFVGHRTSNLSGRAQKDATLVLERLLDAMPEARQVNAPGCWMFTGIWRLDRARLEELIERWKAVSAYVEARRASSRAAQLVLPHHTGFIGAPGWGTVEFEGNGRMFIWTVGSHQILQWNGPSRPGDYTVRAHFARPNAHPQPVISIEYRMHDRENWDKLFHATGPIILEGQIEVVSPGQLLRFEMKTQTWVPAEVLADSADRRELGVQLEFIELIRIED